MSKNIILHLFQWKLKDIIPHLQKIKEQGFNSIQVSPLQQNKEGDEWWKIYQPLSFSIGNKYGSKEDLIELCKEANTYGIKIIVDVVCNHVASRNDNPLEPHEDVDRKLTSNPYFWKERRNIKNWDNRYEVVSLCMGLPTFALDNYDLQDIIIEFLNELVDCGVGGFRFDCAKNMELPEEGSDFWIRVINGIKDKDKLYMYAEIIFSPKELVDKYCKYINVCTNSYGSDKSKLITYVESHDSVKEFKSTNKMTDEMLTREWEVLLHNFNNVLFYARDYSDLWKSDRIREINKK
jgi:glycosidase